MFKSIEYKLYTFILLLIASVAGVTLFAIRGEYVYMIFSLFLGLLMLRGLYQSYNQFNRNILFLLNALDNGDYSFNFSETRLSRRERELNRMMNRIKDILTRARKEIMENEKFLGVVMESVDTGILILDESGQVLRTNRSVNHLLGLPVFTHLKQLSAIDRSLPHLFQSMKAADNPIVKIPNEREERQLSLRVSEVALQGKKLRIVTLNNIGSELDYKEMDSWIRLIRVMTHEIMNSIAPVTSLTDMLLSAFRQRVDEDNREGDDELINNTAEALQTINSTAKGLISFVNSYRRFTGIPKPQLRPADLRTLVEQAVTLEATLLQEKHIGVEYRWPAGEVVLPLDEPQIAQVLVNLLKNAVEANREGGHIRVTLTQQNGKTHLDIANDGLPIPPDLLPNIFVPFFTTKESGTGIGLSVSRYIMRLHGDTLTHFTQANWTCFRMSF